MLEPQRRWSDQCRRPHRQLVIVPVVRAQFKIVDEFVASERRSWGLGLVEINDGQFKAVQSHSLRGMHYSSTGVIYGIAYVIADDAGTGHRKVRDSLEKEKLDLNQIGSCYK